MAEPTKPEAAPQADQAVIENLDKAEIDQLKKVEKLFDDKVSNSKIAEIGRGDMLAIKENKKNAVREVYAKALGDFKNYQEKTKTEKSQSKAERDAIITEIFKEAEKKVEAIKQGIDVSLKLAVKNEYMNEEEAAHFKRVMAGVDKILLQDPQMNTILTKLSLHQALTDADYKAILKLINATPSSAENFEETASGILIGLMQPKERFILMQEMMKSDHAQQTAPMIDRLLRSDILTVAQGKKLFEEAMAHRPPLVNAEQFAQYQKNIDTGVYVEEAKKIRDKFAGEVSRMQGMYNENLLERSFGGPILGAGMVLYSVFGIICNLLASGGSFEEMRKNPYFLMYGGVGLLGTEIASGSFRKGPGFLGIGSGWLSRWFERISEKDKPLNTVQQGAYKTIGEIYLNYPDFGAYLENGGAQTIRTLRKSKEAQGEGGEKLLITAEELLEAEKDATQKNRLQKCLENGKQRVPLLINGIAEATTVLKMEKQSDFNDKIKFMKQDQGLEAGAPTTAPQTAPAPSVLKNPGLTLKPNT